VKLQENYFPELAALLLLETMGRGTLLAVVASGNNLQ
jgi:hypothetical protein